MNVAHIEPRTDLEGPGWRFAVWAQGCPIGCPGCCNPEMLAFEPKRQVTARDLVGEIPDGVEGVSLLGGEPFAQASGFGAFAQAARARGLSVVTFTGFGLAALRRRSDDGVALLLAETDLLIDGPYLASLRSTRRRFVGSDNQQLHFLSDRYRADDPAFAAANQVCMTLSPDGTLHVTGYPALVFDRTPGDETRLA